MDGRSLMTHDEQRGERCGGEPQQARPRGTHQAFLETDDLPANWTSCNATTFEWSLSNVPGGQQSPRADSERDDPVRNLYTHFGHIAGLEAR
jgi:hypothetical protein